MSSGGAFFKSYQLENGEIVALSHIGKEFKYFRFDQELELQQESSTELQRKDFLLTKYLETNSGRYFIESIFNKKSGNWEIKYAKDIAGEVGDVKLLFEHPYDAKRKLIGITLSGYRKVYQDDLRDFKVSNSKEHVCFVNSYNSIEGKNNQALQVAVFDGKLGLAWSSRVTLDEQDKKVALLGYEVSDDGDAYLLFRYEKSKKEVQHYVVIVGPNGEQRIDVNLGTELLSCQIKLIKGNRLAILGYYKEDRNIRGKFFRIYDEENKLEKNFMFKAEDALAKIVESNFLSLFQQRIEREVFSRFIGEYESGALQIIDEEIRISQSESGKLNIELGALVIYSFNPTLDAVKVDVVNRKLFNPSLYNLRPLASFVGDNFCLVYLDKLKKESIVQLTLNENGVLGEKRKLIEVKDVPLKVSSNLSFIIGDNLYLLSRKGISQMTTKFQFSKLSLDN